MRDQLLVFIEEHPRASFSEIEKFFEQHDFDYHGNACIELGGRNIILWTRWNDIAVDLISGFLLDKQIELQPAFWLEMMMFGKLITLPRARQSNRRYKEPHWLPAVISAVNRKGK